MLTWKLTISLALAASAIAKLKGGFTDHCWHITIYPPKSTVRGSLCLVLQAMCNIYQDGQPSGTVNTNLDLNICLLNIGGLKWLKNGGAFASCHECRTRRGDISDNAWIDCEPACGSINLNEGIFADPTTGALSYFDVSGESTVDTNAE